LLPDAAKPVTAPAPVTGAPMESWYEPGHFPPVSAYAEEWGQTFELFKALPYDDRGSLAQGYGHNAASGIAPIPVKGGDAWSKELALEVFRKDLALQVHYLNTYVKVPLLQRHVDAFALDLFQMGPGNWNRDAVLKKLNAKDYAGAAQTMRDRADIKGLDRRRNVQANIAIGKRPDPKDW
jgi:lysozyme